MFVILGLHEILLDCCDALFDRYLWCILYVVSDVLNAFITTFSIPLLVRWELAEMKVIEGRSRGVCLTKHLIYVLSRFILHQHYSSRI